MFIKSKKILKYKSADKLVIRSKKVVLLHPQLADPWILEWLEFLTT